MSIGRRDLEHLTRPGFVEWYGDVLAFLILGQAGISKWTKMRQRNVKRKALRYRIRGRELMYLEVDESLARCVSVEERTQVLRWAHDGHGHYSSIITMSRLRGFYFWPSRVADVGKWSNSCEVCQQTGGRLTREIPRTITVLEPMSLFGMDFIGPINPPAVDGSKYVLVGVDYFSRFIFAEPVKDATGEEVARIFLHVWSKIFGWPVQTYSDNGSHFKNKLLIDVLNMHGTLMVFGPVSHPQSTGLPERCVQLLKQQMTKWAIGRGGLTLTEWNLQIARLTTRINGRYVKSLGMSPSEVFLGFRPRLQEDPVDQQVSMVPADALATGVFDEPLTFQAVQAYVDKRHAWREEISDERVSHGEEMSRKTEFKAGDLVWEKRVKVGRDTSKFLPDWLGPRIVLRRASDVSYWVRDVYDSGKVKPRKVHAGDLKRYKVRPHDLEG